MAVFNNSNNLFVLAERGFPYQKISNMIYDFIIVNRKLSKDQRKVIVINSNSTVIFVKYMEGGGYEVVKFRITTFQTSRQKI